MKISLIQVGKTQDKTLEAFILDYKKRINRYAQFEIINLKEAKVHKNESKDIYRKKEAEALNEEISKHPFPILLDEKGQEHSSVAFAHQCQTWLEQHNHISFIIGGAYGFHEDIYTLGFTKIALSKMTFTHQWARLILIEQIYRALSILNNQGYHH